MKKKTKENVFLKQDTKSDIQELFEELFVGELNKKITNVSNQTSGNIDALESIKKQNILNSTVICDRIDELRNDLQCVGTVDDWGEETLITFLNQLAQLIVSCKSEVDKHSVFFGNQYEKITLQESIKNIICQLEETHQLLENVENGILKNGFEKISSNFIHLDEMTSLIELINNNVILLVNSFEEGGVIKELHDLQKEFSDDLMICKEYVIEIDNKLDSVVFSIEKLSNMLSEIIELRKIEISTLNDTFRMSNEEIIKQMESFMLQNKKKFTYVFTGMGFLVITNVVMLVMLLIK